MEALRNKLENIQKLDINTILNKVLSDASLQEWILDLNRKDQIFEKGIDSNNVEIRGFTGGYSEVTQELSQGLIFTYKGSSKAKISGEPFFLYDEGLFFRSFVMILGSNYFEINADPIRGDTNIFERFGSDILGLTEESMQKLREKLLPLIIQIVKNTI